MRPPGKLSKLRPATNRSGERPALTDPWLDVEAEAVFASDTFVAVKIPVEIADGDVSGPLPLDALELFENRHSLRHGIACRAEELSDGHYTVRRHATGQPPKIDGLIEKAREKEVVFEVGLTAELVANLAKAMGATKLRLSFTGATEPIIVEALDAVDDPVALMMPIRLSDPRVGVETAGAATSP